LSQINPARRFEVGVMAGDAGCGSMSSLTYAWMMTARSPDDWIKAAAIPFYHFEFSIVQ
jgi:hypothetical protein